MADKKKGRPKKKKEEGKPPEKALVKPTPAHLVSLEDEENMKKIRERAMYALVLHKDMSGLEPRERVIFSIDMAQSRGLDWRTGPFAYIWINTKDPQTGQYKWKLVPYATKDCSDQYIKRDKLSVFPVGEPKMVEGVFIVTMKAQTPDGRTNIDIGAVALDNLTADKKASAMKKAYTQGKRRAVLGISGMGILDESEIENLPDWSTAPLIPGTTPKDVVEETRAEELSQETSGHMESIREETNDSSDKKEKAALAEWRVKILGSIIGKDKRFGSHVKDAKDWIRSVSGAELNDLTADQCTVVEAAILDEELPPIPDDDQPELPMEPK